MTFLLLPLLPLLLLFLLSTPAPSHALTPPPVLLNITFPQNNKGISGSTLTVTAEVVLTDDKYDVEQFVLDWMDRSEICIAFNATTFPDSNDGEPGVLMRCHKMDTASMKFVDVPFGSHIIRAWLIDRHKNNDILCETQIVHFFTTSLPPTEVKISDPLSIDLIAQQETLLEWLARLERTSSPDELLDIQYTNVDFSPTAQPVNSCRSIPKTYDSTPNPSPNSNANVGGNNNSLRRFLMIGVKSSVNAFEYRQAIRSAWSSRTQEDPDTCVFFLIGGLNETQHAEKKAKKLNNALKNEQRIFGDLLLYPDLPVIDSYYTLVEKTSKFMKFAVVNYKFSYLMICDDDVFLDVRALTTGLRDSASRTKFYAGQVWEIQYKRKIRPNRDETHRNSLTEAEYPFDTLPPFAIGPHFVVSYDCAHFIATNEHALKGVGTLEDVTMSFWLMSIGVKAQHVPWFNNARNEECTNNLVSLADLRPHGIKRVGLNVQQGKPLCEGFQRDWVREGTALSEVGNQIKGDDDEGTADGDSNKRDEDEDEDEDGISIDRPFLGEIFPGNEIILSISSSVMPKNVCLTGNNNTLVLNDDVSGNHDKHRLCFAYNGAIELGNFFTGTHVVSVNDRRVIFDLLGNNSGAQGLSDIVDVDAIFAMQEESNKLNENIIAEARPLPDRLRVTILMINFDDNSQNNMYKNLALNLPRDLFAVEIIVAAGIGLNSNREFVREISRAFVPITTFPSPQADKLLRATDISIIANSNDDADMFALLRLAKDSNVRLVMDLPNSVVDDEIVAMDVVDHFVAPSHHVKSILGSQKNVKVIYPVAVDIDPLDAVLHEEVRHWTSGRPIRIGYLGRLSPERSPGLFFHMARYLLDRQLTSSSTFEFVIAGSGPLHGSLVELARVLNIDQSVRFVGNLSPTEVDGFLHDDVDVIVNTRMTETFGISNVEAIKAGVTVVAFRIGGNRESAAHGSGGILVDVKEGFEGLGNAVLNLKSLDKSTMAKFRRKGQTNIRTMFTQKQFIDGYASLFLNMAADARSPQTKHAPAPLASTWTTSSSTSINGHHLKVVYSPYAGYLRNVLFKIFPQMFPTFDIIIKEEDPLNNDADVVFVSALDGGCGTTWEFKCRSVLEQFREKYPSSSLVLVSGEAWDFSDATRLGADIFMGCHKNSQHLPPSIPYVHFPPAHSSWGERRLSSYRELFRQSSVSDGNDELKQATNRYRVASKTKFAAYMYSRCDRPERERFFDILDETASKRLGLRVDALGACGGHKSNAEKPERRANRFVESWHDDAVVTYRNYHFVIAFENIVEDGYVTEKIVNAMLAGSIPIYWGTEDVETLFNGRSFIHCGVQSDHASLQRCADRVIALYKDKSRLEEMMGEVWGDEATLRDEFGFLEIGNAPGRITREMKEAIISVEQRNKLKCSNS